MIGKFFIIVTTVGCVFASHLGSLYETPSVSAKPLATSYGVPLPSTSYLQAPSYSAQYTAPSTTTQVQTVHYSKPSVQTVEYAVPVTTYQYVKKNVLTQEPATAQISYQVPQVSTVQSEQYYYVPLKDAKVYYVNKVAGGSLANTASSLSYSTNLGGLSSSSGLSYASVGGSSGLDLSSLYGTGVSSDLSYSSLGGGSLSLSSLGSSGLDYSSLQGTGLSATSGLDYSSLYGSGLGQSSTVW